MIVKNEEADLPRCLQSVQGIVDEIILVDTGSTDRTVEIGERFGARIFHHPWQGDFSAPRNYGIDQASGDWILILDADETLEPECAAQIKTVLSQTSAAGVWSHVRNLLAPESLIQYFDDRQVRLFRNRPAYRYSQRVHEQIVFAILEQGEEVSESDLIFLHYGYAKSQVQGEGERIERNLKLLEQAVIEDPDNPYLAIKLGSSYYRVKEWELAFKHLHRAFCHPEFSRLPSQIVSSAMLILVELALRSGDFPVALQWASLNLQLEQKNPALALNQLAVVYKQLGQKYLERVTQAVLGEEPGMTLVVENVPATRQDLREAAAAFQKAIEAWQQARQAPNLHPQAQEAMAREMEICKAQVQRLRATRLQPPTLPALSPEQVFQHLLEADDINIAFQQYRPLFSKALVAKIRAEERVARQEGETDLAEGLEALASQIQEQLPAGQSGG